MQSIVLKISEIDLKDRLTVEHYLSRDIQLINKLSKSIYTLISLGKVAEVKGGKRLPANAKYSTTGVPYVRVVDVGDFEVNLSSVVYISEDLHNKIQRYQLKPNDIVLVIVGATIGKAAIFLSPVSPCNFNENLARITIKDQNINSQYLLTYLQSCFGQAYISWLTGGSAQAKLSLERIEKIKIPLPSLSIQEVIAQVIYDAYESSKNKLVEADNLLKTMDAWVFERSGISFVKIHSNKYWTIESSLIKGKRWDVNYYQASNPKQINEVNWCTFNNYVDICKETFFPSRQPDENYYYVGIQDMDNDPYSSHEVAKIAQGNEINGLSQNFRSGDILLARLAPSLSNKKSVIVSENVSNGCGSPEFLVLRPKDGIDSRFVLWVIKSDFMLEQMLLKTRGATPSRMRLYPQDLLKLRVPKVNKNQQHIIGQEMENRRMKAKYLYSEAENLISKAKARVERMILGEEEVT